MKGTPFFQELDLDFGLSLKVSGFAVPRRPPPRCSNPDDSRFSDPGDPAEMEIEKVVISNGKMDIEISSDFWAEIIEDLETEIWERLESQELEPPEDDDDRKYHEKVDEGKI